MNDMETASCDRLRKQLFPVWERYRKKIVAAYLFGSLVEGGSHPKSDVDLAVLPEKLSRDSLYQLREALYVDICRVLKSDDVDLVVLRSSGNLMLNDRIIHKGSLLWEKESDRRKEFEAEQLHRILDFKQRRYRTLGV